jgi:hypothetical protein
MSSARVRMPRGLNDLLRSEMELCIEQANLGRDDTVIARRYLIDQWPQIDIAAEFGWTRSTISGRVSRIVPKVEKTAKKLNLS